MLAFFLLFVMAYLCGSLSSAVIVCRLVGLPDPRTVGSKNPGTTNVFRIGGKKWAVIVLLVDVLKGIIPIFVATAIGIQNTALALIALAAFIGHLFPVFFHFKGGKGVATAFGVIMALSWPLALAIAATWLISLILFRYVSLSSLIATALMPIYSIWLSNPHYFLIMIIMSILLIWRHAENINRLLAGTERKI